MIRILASDVFRLKFVKIIMKLIICTYSIGTACFANLFLLFIAEPDKINELWGSFLSIV
jgi:hypothetical protein